MPVLKSRRRTSGPGPWIAEAVLIVLSIALGLMANDWRIAREHEKVADTALAFIREELNSNQVKIQETLPVHNQVSDSLAVLMNRVLTSGEPISARDMFLAMPKGFVIPLVSRNSWDLANQTGAINYLEFELANSLSQLYDQQDFYQKKLDIAGENFYVAGNINTTDQSATALAIGLLANDVVIQEERLVKRYAAMVSRLDSLIASK